MSLDVVELAIRTEEVFCVELPNDECALVSTVGDLYRLVLNKLHLPYVSAVEIESQLNAGVFIRDRSRFRSSMTQTWSAGEVWVTLKATVQDQLQVDPEQVRESASFVYDLGCD